MRELEPAIVLIWFLFGLGMMLASMVQWAGPNSRLGKCLLIAAAGCEVAAVVLIASISFVARLALAIIACAIGLVIAILRCRARGKTWKEAMVRDTCQTSGFCREYNRSRSRKEGPRVEEYLQFRMTCLPAPASPAVEASLGGILLPQLRDIICQYALPDWGPFPFTHMNYPTSCIRCAICVSVMPVGTVIEFHTPGHFAFTRWQNDTLNPLNHSSKHPFVLVRTKHGCRFECGPHKLEIKEFELHLLLLDRETEKQVNDPGHEC